MSLSDKISARKKELNMTNQQLADLSGVNISSVSKIAAGIVKNPKLETLRALASALECTIDDFREKDETNLISETEQVHEPVQQYYVNDDVANLAQEIYDNPELRILFDASRKLQRDDVLAVVDIVKRMKGYTD